MFHKFLLRKIGIGLVVTGLVFSSSTSVFAQSEEVDAEQDSMEATFWEESAGEEAVVAKPEQDVIMPADDKASVEAGNPNKLYLPIVVTAGNEAVNAANTDNIAAAKFIILDEGFEGAWPTGLWKVKNTNGGTVVWDDVSFQHHSGNWSAQPADSTTYPNNLSTYMQYGPFALPGTTANNHHFSFYYWLNSEAGHDFFTWSYSCNNGASWVQASKSGSSQGWKQVFVSLLPCMNKTQVLIRFAFTSDNSNPFCGILICRPGVYVDDVRIEYTWLT